MTRIKALENFGGETAVITVEGVVVGGINMSSPGVYSVKTEGRVPAIDGLSARCPREVWAAVVEKVQAHTVFHDGEMVQIGPEDD